MEKSEKLEILLERAKSVCNDINNRGGRIYIDGKENFVYMGNTVNQISSYEVLRRYEKLRDFVNDIWVELEGIAREGK